VVDEMGLSRLADQRWFDVFVWRTQWLQWTQPERGPPGVRP
jgi:hypothetical protein